MHTNMKKMMKKKTTRILTLVPACLALMLTACDDKTLYTHAQLYGSPLAVSANWAGRTPTADQLTVSIESLTPGIGDAPSLSLSATGTAETTLPEATYRLTATHPADHLALDGSLFRLDAPDADGLLPQPGPLAAASVEASLTAQQPNLISLPMRVLTRTLCLRFVLGTTDNADIAGLDVRLAGMATSVTLDGTDRMQTEAGPIGLSLQPEAPADGDGNRVAYAATVRTLGTHPRERQTMDVVVRLADGTAFHAEADASAALRALNAQATDEPFTATFRLVGAGRPGNDVHFSIGPWEEVPTDDSGDAGMVVE